MKRIILILFCLTVLLSLTSCKSHPPEEMQKWSTGDFDLYRLEGAHGFLAYTKPQEDIVFDFTFNYGCSMYVFKHRETSDQPSEMVAEYDFLVNLSNSKWSCSLSKVYDDSLKEVFPSRLNFKKKAENLTYDKIPYEFVYGNPLKQNITHLTYSNYFDLYISESKETGYIEFLSEDVPEKMLDVVFESDGKMTVYSRVDNTVKGKYFIYQTCDEIFAKCLDDDLKIVDGPSEYDLYLLDVTNES